MKIRAAVCRTFGAPLSIEEVELATPAPARSGSKSPLARSATATFFISTAPGAATCPRSTATRRRGSSKRRSRRDAPQGRRSRRRDPHPLLRRLPLVLGRRAGVLRGSVPARPQEPAHGQGGNVDRTWHAHRRFRRPRRRRRQPGRGHPEDHAARQRGADRLRRADRHGRGHQHRRRQGGIERRRHRLRRRRAQQRAGRETRGLRRSSPSMSRTRSSRPRAPSARPTPSTPKPRTSPREGR